VNTARKQQFRLTGFTLIEVLVVLTIAGLLFSLMFTGIATSSASFSASQAGKNMTLLTRSARRQSMLITKSSIEPWVYGVGMQFSKSGSNAWEYQTIKLRNTGNLGVGASFYIPYPKNIVNLPSSTYDFVNFGDIYKLPVDLALSFTSITAPSIELCSLNIFIVVFESVNGSPYFYCDRQAIGVDSVEIQMFQGSIARGQVLGITTGGNIFAYEK